MILLYDKKYACPNCKSNFTTKKPLSSKLRVETRKWIASKLKPKKYGDKVQTEHSGSVAITPITGMEIK